MPHRLEPSSTGMLYQLLRKEQILSEGILAWDDWPTKIFPETNEIIINQQKLKIGREHIYEKIFTYYEYYKELYGRDI